LIIFETYKIVKIIDRVGPKVKQLSKDLRPPKKKEKKVIKENIIIQ
jgi:hypothetical protein